MASVCETVTLVAAGSAGGAVQCGAVLARDLMLKRTPAISAVRCNAHERPLAAAGARQRDDAVQNPS
jgi:hypothetical protein